MTTLVISQDGGLCPSFTSLDCCCSTEALELMDNPVCPSNTPKLTRFLRVDSWSIFYSLFYLKIWVFLKLCNINVCVCLKGKPFSFQNKWPRWLKLIRRDCSFRKMISIVTVLSLHWIASCSWRFCVKMYKSCVFSACKHWSQQNFPNVYDLMKPISSFPLRIVLLQLYII